MTYKDLMADRSEEEKQTRDLLRFCLHKYGFTAYPPNRTDKDSRAIAFYKDAEAVEALRNYRRIHGRKDYKDNPEMIQLRNKISYELNKEQRLLDLSNYRANHKVERQTYDQIYYRAHSYVYKEAAHRRRMVLMGILGTHTHEEFEIVCKEFEYRCIYCGKDENEIGKLTEDHLTPITRDGTDWIDNIVPACRGCNSSKSNKTFEEFIDWLETRMLKPSVL